MSATIEAQMFANYFSSRVEGIPRPAPKLSVEGRTHPVLEFFLDDIRHVGTVSVWCECVGCVWEVFCYVHY